MHVHSSSWIKKLLTVSSAHSNLNKFNFNMGIRSSVLTDLAYLYSEVLQTCLSLMSFYLEIMQVFFSFYKYTHVWSKINFCMNNCFKYMLQFTVFQTKLSHLQWSEIPGTSRAAHMIISSVHSNKITFVLMQSYLYIKMDF